MRSLARHRGCRGLSKVVVGRRFGKLVITRNTGADTRGRQYWRAQCDCGGSKRVRSDALLSGKITQCQKCTNKQAGRLREIHGMSCHPLYDTWRNMMDRCYLQNHISYPNYGGRGIQVWIGWQDLSAFIQSITATLGPRPEGCTLDRVDNNGGYGPTNCRWATKSQQANNTRVSHTLTHNGVTRTIAQWSKIRKILESTIRERVKRGWPVEKVLKRGRQK